MVYGTVSKWWVLKHVVLKELQAMQGWPVKKPCHRQLRATVAVETTIADGPRTDPYERVYAYGSYEG
jgi:hypothetical protein